MATIRKRGDSYQIDYYDPNGERVRKTFKKKKVAEAELGKRVSLIAEGRYLDVKKEYRNTFKQLVKKYTENFQHQVSFESFKKYCLKNFKEYFGEDTLLANIRYVEIETYRNRLRQKLTKNGRIRTDAAVNREMSCLHHLFAKAVSWEMVERNPFDQGETLLLKESNERLRYLEKDEIDRLLAECPKHLKYIVECAINTGMRRGEILKLKWSDVNLKTGHIYVRETKTKKPRHVPINDTLGVLLSQIKKEQGLDSEYVFTYRKSQDKLKGPKPVRKRQGPTPVPQAVSSIKTAFNASLRRAGIEDFKFHDLRHTFASHFVMRGGTLKELQEILGHKTMTMTLRYAHLSQEHKKKAVNLLNGLTASKPFGHKMVTNPNSSPVTTDLSI